VSERSEVISKLLSDIDVRTAYIRAKLGTLVPAQIRAVRLKSDMPRQLDLAKEAQLHQSRISMFETPGAANVTLETLSRLAAAFKVGLVVKFVPFSDMLQWENEFSQDTFNPTKIENDQAFIDPPVVAKSQKVAPPAASLRRLKLRGNLQGNVVRLRVVPPTQKQDVEAPIKTLQPAI
jgi:transcriptional regulator with XRE-family HTH domain